jgi:toxin secretion/phage lysis holin
MIMHKEGMFKIIFASIIGGLAAYFKVMAIPIFMLIIVMVIDYISSMVKAWITAQLSSKIGLRGIIKKLCYLLVVCVAAVVDWLITSGLKNVGIQVTATYYIGVIVTIWLIINELISILENLSAIGIPLPGFLAKLVKKLKNQVEKQNETEAET